MDDDQDQFERIRRDWPGGTMPCGRESSRRRGRNQTHKSKRGAKRIGQSSGGDGIHKRRRKRVD